MTTKTIFEPVYAPCKGMVTTMDSVSLTPGQYELLQNVRIDTGVFKVRDGAYDLSASGLDAGWCVGCAQLSMNGTDYVFVAVDTGSDIRVYSSTGETFTEITRNESPSTSYNQTRFVSGVTPANYKNISFAVVKATSRPDSGILSTYADQDFLLVSDGVKVLVSAYGNYGLRPLIRVSAGTDFGKFRQEATFPDFMPISSGLSGTTRSDADVTVSTGSTISGHGSAPLITFTTAADTDDYGELQWTTANDMCQGPCAVLMYVCTDTAIWDKVKLGFVHDAAGTPTVYTIWDPTSTTTTRDRPTVVTVDATRNCYMAVFPLDPANTPTATTFNGFRLTYKLPASPAAQIDFYLLGWYAGGKVPGAVRAIDGTITGTTQFWVTNYGSTFYSESEPVKCQDLGGIENTQLGMTDKLNRFQIPVFAECTYSYRITYQATTQGGNGVDYALIYCQFADSTNYRPDAAYLIAQDQVAEYSAGSWGYLSGYSSGGLQSVSINTSVLLPRECTKPFHRPPMPFKAAVWSDGRLFLGGVKKDDSASYFGGFFASAKGNPFDFSEFERFLPDGTLDVTGPVIVPLGGELPQAIVCVSGVRSELEVSSPLVIVTNKSAWAVDTKDASTLIRPSYLCAYGTAAPASVCTGNGRVFWFDRSKQIRMLSQTLDSPSLWRVESLWYGIPTTTDRTGSNRQSNPRSERVSCAFFKDKLYVAYTPTGQSYNVACSVYDLIKDIWYDDALGVNFERLFVWPTSGDVPQLRAFTVGDDVTSYSAAPKLYQHEKSGQTTDDGTGITINVLTSYLHMSDRDEPMATWAFADVGIVADKSSGESLSVVKTLYPSGDTVTGTIDMATNVSGNQLARWERDSDGNKPLLASGLACRVSVQGTYASTKRIMAIYMHVDQRSPGTGVKR